MALYKNMKTDQIKHFIDDELIPQCKQEIQNLIHPPNHQIGYFVVTRQIMCLVDFLGTVYWGKPNSKVEKGKNLAREEKALKFINTFFKPKYTYNKSTVKILYSMYRHGLVHLYQPKHIKLKNGNLLRWFFYYGNRHQDRVRTNSDDGEKIFENVHHLKFIYTSDKKIGYLPICINILYEDFEKALQEYRAKLLDSKSLQKKWRITVNAICEPKLIEVS